MSRPISLRVLLLNYEFPPMGGGAGCATFEIACHLVAKGCEVDVVTSGMAGQAAVETIKGFRVHRVASRRRSIQECGVLGAWTYVAAAQPVFRRLLRARRYDIIHYFFGLPTGALALCTPGAGHVPCLVSLRGSDVPGYDTVNRTLRAAHRVLLPLTHRIWRNADRLVANSYGLRTLAEHVVSNKPIEVIPNGVDCAMFSPRRHSAAEETRSGASSTIYILAVARLIPRKGLDDLLRAVAMLEDIRIQLAIQGLGGESQRLQELAISLGVHPQVTFAGFLDREHLPPVYQAADIFVLPSHSESCAMALLEAMACGLPVVATAVGGTVEHVLEGVNGFLVPPGQPAALAAALRKLIDDPQLRQMMGERNARTMQEAYSWQGITDQYLTVYQQIVADGRPRSDVASSIVGRNEVPPDPPRA